MHLFIQPVGGPAFEMEVPQSISVEELEKRLMAEKKFPEGIYRFVYNGTILENNLNGVADYGIVIVGVFERPKRQVDEFAVRALEIMTRNGTLAAYNPQYNFLEHPDECAEFGRLVTPRAPRYVAQNMLIDRFRMGLRYAGARLPVVWNLCGIYNRVTPIIDEVELGIQVMSNQQREAFQRLLQRGFDRNTTYVIFSQCNFDEELARQRLVAE